MWQYRWFRVSTYVAVLAWTSVIASLWLVILDVTEMTGRGMWATVGLWAIAVAASAIREANKK